MDLQVDGKFAFVATLGREINPTNPSIVFVHGAGLDHTVWTLTMRYFARHGRNVLAVDLPGHGRSAGSALVKITDMAEWINKVIETVGLKETAIAGHSMGSLAALEVAVRYPRRLRALALLGTSAPMPVHERLLSAAKDNDHAAVDMLNLWGYSFPAQVGGCGAPGMWKTGGNERLLERAAGGVLYADLNACNEYGDRAEQAAQVRCPTLLIIGDRDVMTPPAASQHLGQTIPEARTIVVENCGHAMLSEQPNAVLDALSEIL
ncbi:MAG: alpha/beta fold hydrolase [Acidiferrobacterales bacterium]